MVAKRYDYIDVAKGIGILTVVWAHILLVGWSHRLIYAFHMPLFFFISGMLFKKDKFFSFGDFLHVRFNRLVVPYVIYSVITWCLWAAFNYFRGGEVCYWKPLLQTFIAQGSGSFLVHNSPLWFIPCLFAVEIMYYFISKVGECMTFLICSLMAIAGVIMAHMYGTAYLTLLPWNLDAAFYGLLFFCVGNILMHRISHEQIMNCVSKRRLIFMGVSIGLFAILWYLAMNFGECSMGSSSYQCAEWIFFVRAFIGCVWLVLCSVVICSFPELRLITKFLKWCGKNSLDIMCQHVPIKGVIIIVMSVLLKLCVEISEVASLSAIVFVLTMVICIILTMAINKYIRKQS